jgi:hypothetical protein
MAMTMLSGIARTLFIAACVLSCDRDHPDWEVRARSADQIQFGTSLAEAAAAIGVMPPYSPPTQPCGYWTPPIAPPGFSLMVENGKVVRVDVDSARIFTNTGIGVGSTIQAVDSVYNKSLLPRQPHKYRSAEGWRYLTAWEPDSTAAIVFEVDSHVVRNYRAGLTPQVLNVERCQ